MNYLIVSIYRLLMLCLVLFCVQLALICYTSYKYGMHVAYARIIKEANSQFINISKRNEYVTFLVEHMVSKLVGINKRISNIHINKRLKSSILLIANMMAAVALLTILKISSLFISLMMIVFASLLGCVDGLCYRYIRTMEGGRESTFLYHQGSEKLLMLASMFIFGFVLLSSFDYPQGVVAILALIGFTYTYTTFSQLKKYL